MWLIPSIDFVTNSGYNLKLDNLLDNFEDFEAISRLLLGRSPSILTVCWQFKKEKSYNRAEVTQTEAGHSPTVESHRYM